MSIPPHILSQILAVVMVSPERAEELIELRTQGANNQVQARISLKAAQSMALNGEIEGVGTRNRLKYVRKLTSPAPASKVVEIHSSKASVVARLNMGAYKQPMREVFTNEHGNVIEEGEIHGWVYSLCWCRKIDGALEKAA